MVWVLPGSSERESRLRCSLLKLLCYATFRAEIPPPNRVAVRKNEKTIARRRLRPERQPPPPSYRRLPLLFLQR